MANWRAGVGRLGIALSVAWVIGWIVFFIYLAAGELPKPIDYLTFAVIIFAPPGAVLLIGWVWSAFATKS